MAFTQFGDTSRPISLTRSGTQSPYATDSGGDWVNGQYQAGANPNANVDPSSSWNTGSMDPRANTPGYDQFGNPTGSGSNTPGTPQYFGTSATGGGQNTSNVYDFNATHQRDANGNLIPAGSDPYKTAPTGGLDPNTTGGTGTGTGLGGAANIYDWLKGVTSTSTNGTGTVQYDPFGRQFATPDTAQGIAKQFGGNAFGFQPEAGFGQYSQPTQMVGFGNGNQINAGLAADALSKYGSGPGSYGEFLVNRDKNGIYSDYSQNDPWANKNIDPGFAKYAAQNNAQIQQNNQLMEQIKAANGGSIPQEMQRQMLGQNISQIMNQGSQRPPDGQQFGTQPMPNPNQLGPGPQPGQGNGQNYGLGNTLMPPGGQGGQQGNFFQQLGPIMQLLQMLGIGGGGGQGGGYQRPPQLPPGGGGGFPYYSKFA